MPTTTVTLPDGAKLAVHMAGNGPDIMLISGLSGTASSWVAVVPELAQRFRVITFDQRGIGASTRGAAKVDIDQLADDSSAILKALNSPRATLVGHSTGGCIIQAMAVRDPARAAGLVLSGTWLRPNRYMAELFKSRLSLLRASPRDYAAMVQFIGLPADHINANWPAYEAAVAAAPMTAAQQDIVAERIAAIMAFDGASKVNAIKAPQLIVGADDDLIVPAFLQHELKSALPQAQMHMLPTGGHFFTLSRAKPFASEIARFAAKVMA